MKYFILFSLLGFLAGGCTKSVAPDPTPVSTASTTKKVPQQYATIQQAIVAAKQGDTVLVAAGTYTGQIDFMGKNIKLIGASGAGATILDGTNAGTVVYVGNRETNACTIEGFTIKNGKTATNTSGGGITIINASPTIKNNIIQDNTSNAGGGINCVGVCSPLIINNIIRQNHSTVAAVGGGGGINFSNNSTNPAEVSNPIIKHNQITNNDAVYNAGGVNFSGNGVAGLLDSNTVATNNALYGAGIHLDTYAHPVISHNSITSNASQLNGAGIGVGNLCYPRIEYNTIANNSCPGKGGGIQCFNAKPSIVFNLIYGNEAGMGAGIYVWTTSNPLLVNNTLVFNKAGMAGGGIGIDPTARPVIANSILWYNTSPADPQLNGLPALLLATNVQDAAPGNGVITNLNPRFVDAASHNYHLLPDSPCIDAGVVSYSSNGVVVFTIPAGQFKGKAPDLGYAEF